MTYEVSNDREISVVVRLGILGATSTHQRCLPPVEENPAHPSLRFKKVHPRLPIYSVRIDLDWRAVGILEDGTLVWFWVDPHPQYEALLKSLRN